MSPMGMLRIYIFSCLLSIFPMSFLQCFGYDHLAGDRDFILSAPVKPSLAYLSIYQTHLLQLLCIFLFHS